MTEQSTEDTPSPTTPSDALFATPNPIDTTNEPEAPQPPPVATPAAITTDVMGIPVARQRDQQFGRPVSRGDAASSRHRAMAAIDRLEVQMRQTVALAAMAAMDRAAVGDAETAFRDGLAKLRAAIN